MNIPNCELTTNTLKISNGIIQDIESGALIELKIGNINNPLSTSIFSGIVLYILDTNGYYIEYIQNGSFSITQAPELTSVYVHSSNILNNSQTNLSLEIYPNGIFQENCSIEIIFPFSISNFSNFSFKMI